jgi:hypothetical protein
MTYSTLNTCFLLGALALTGCHKSEPEPSPTPQTAPAQPQPQPQPTAQVPDAKDTAMAGMPADSAMAGKAADSAMAAGMEAPAALSDQLSKSLGLTPAQAKRGVGPGLAVRSEQAARLGLR